jgi:hypothetical protein
MQIEGQIHPKSDAVAFTREAWCQLVRHRREFRRHGPRKATNPFTGEEMTVNTTDDAAEVVREGRVVGSVYWSMSDEQLVIVSIELSAMPLVSEWAAALGGEFRPDLPNVE